ncbi:hypothetical protein PHMEG_0005166 [Phytophthora megakarya]|uniref:Uncharacterized protein n=1 Tax=Phytophthora megakarya TaxID=4795 RepID=A0A225WTI9_9STRA|nr:hypothetical protein PHMEG_0005166 [Phytophthora megakarya]
MGKTPEHRIFTPAGALRYRRKVPAPVDNQQPEQPPKEKEKDEPKRKSRSSRFRPKQPKQPQPALLKQILWKAKAVQPTPVATVTQQDEDEEDEEDEEEAFATEQRQARKLLASEVASKNKTTDAPTSEPFVAESSSQETQSGSEDETVFLPYSNLLPEWQFTQHEDTDGEETASPVMPMKEQDALEKRRKRQKNKLRQKQKRATKQQRLQHQQKHDAERPRPAEVSTSTKDEDSVDIFHPPTNLASEMDAGVCRAVLSQLKEVVPFIVIGDVACPMVSAEQSPVSAGRSDKREPSASKPEEAIVDFRHHVIAMLDRSKETQMRYRESFVVEESGFDAASSYDFFKHRMCALYLGRNCCSLLTRLCCMFVQVFARSRGPLALCTTNGFLRS